MSSPYYPQDTTKADLDHIEGSDLDLLQERWLEDNLSDLEKEFFEEHLDDDMGGPMWDKFLDKKWEAYLSEIS